MKALLIGALGLSTIALARKEIVQESGFSDDIAIMANIINYKKRPTGKIDAGIVKRAPQQEKFHTDMLAQREKVMGNKVGQVAGRLLRNVAKKAAKKAKKQQKKADKKAAKAQQQPEAAPAPAPEAETEEPVQESGFPEDIAQMAAIINRGKDIQIAEKVKQLSPFAQEILDMRAKLFPEDKAKLLSGQRSLAKSAKKAAKKARKQQKKAEKKAAKAQQQPEAAPAPAPEAETEEPVQESGLAEDIAQMAAIINRGNIQIPEKVKLLSPFAQEIINMHDKIKRGIKINA